MGFFDELQNKASEMLGGSDIASSAQDVTGSAQDAAGSIQDLSTDMQDQITQYAADNNVSIEAAKEHILGGGN